MAMVPVVAATPLGGAEGHPVGRPVAGSPEAAAIHEGFQRINRMAILALPVGANLSADRPEQVAGQVRHRDPGQDQKARVVGQAREVVFPRPAFPSDEGIARGALPRGRSEQRAAQRPAGRGRVPDSFSPTVLRWPR